MEISLQSLGKRFQREWIFRELSLPLVAGGRYAVVGPNGSGKSTLLKVIAGALPATEGSIQYLNGRAIPADEIYRHLAYAAPYLELIEAFSLREQLNFHFTFKKKREKLSIQQMADRLWLGNALDKPIRFFSSGMRQRLKLGLCFLSDCRLLLLDEPTTNLDAQGTAWYLEQIERLPPNVTVLVGSNQPHEYNFCSEEINILDFKPTR